MAKKSNKVVSPLATEAKKEEKLIMATSDGKQKAAEPSGINLIHVLPLDKVLNDLDWNPRNKSAVFRSVKADKAPAGYDPETESTGLGGGIDGVEPGLVESLIAEGQRTPGDVRPNPNPKTAGKYPYMTVDCHRRYEALSLLAKQSVAKGDFFPIKNDPTWDARKPTIRVVIHENMTEWEAITFASASGTQREGLETPDLAFACKRILEESRKAKNELSQSAIALRLGKTQGHVSQLLKIMGLPAKMTQHWRTCGAGTFAGEQVVTSGSLDIRSMLAVTNVSDDEKEKEYVKRCKGLIATSTGNGSPEQKKHDAACGRAKKLGEVVGYLIVTGSMTVAPDWRSFLEYNVGFKRLDGSEPTADQSTALVLAASGACEEKVKEMRTPKEPTAPAAAANGATAAASPAS